MALIERTSFARGWVPDVDAVGAPVDALLRADNLLLDELGRLSLRLGTSLLATVGTDVHSLFTATLNGTKQRFAGSGNVVYGNGGAVLVSGFGGSNDIAFGSHRGQVLMARSATKAKYDGIAVRNWGLVQTGNAPTIVPAAPDGKTFASCDSAEAPAFVVDEDDGTGATFADGQDNAANGSIVVHPAATGRATITKTFAADTNFTVYDGGTIGTDDDLLTLWVYVTEPGDLLSLDLMVDVNSSSVHLFEDDYYVGHVLAGVDEELSQDEDTLLEGDYTARGRVREVVRSRAERRAARVSRLRTDKPVVNAGWSKLSIRRSQMKRTGSTSGKDWTTVKAIRLIATTIVATQIQYDTVQIQSANIYGPYKWAYVLAYNSGSYVGLSAPSPFSAETPLQSHSAEVTVPADGGRDAQTNEVWLFRMGGLLDDFYRVAVATGGGAGAITIVDSLGDRDALILNIKLEFDNGPPPDGIVSIAGPYFDRAFALTPTALYPSRRLNPDSFATGQVIKVAGADEVAYWVKKAFGGLYIGTSKDIYRLSGTGGELPDGTIDFVFEPLNIDHPPIGDGVVQDGNRLFYIAADGWRGVAGAGSESLTGSTSLLYRGYTRHGVSPVNLTSGRFRGAIANKQLVALTPEGSSTTSSTVLYRHAPGAWWFRHVYGVNLRTVYTEPDGTLLAGDDAGNVWVLDSGTSDNGAGIPVTLWTKADDLGMAQQRKDPWDVRLKLDTGGVAATVALHRDASETATASFAATQSGLGVTLADVSAIGVFRLLQLRLTVTATTFGFYDYGVGFRPHPAITSFVEQKPEIPSLQRRRFGGLQILIDTLGGNATVTPILDGVAKAAFTVNTTDAFAKTLTFQTLVGRDLWAKITKTDGFELYQIAPLITETLPVIFQGSTPRSPFGGPRLKTLSGLQFRVCTLGLARTFTPILDGVAQTAFTITSSLNDPMEYTHDFPTALHAADLAFSVDGDIELYDWKPLISASRPYGVLTWDSGPIDLGTKEIVWLRWLYVKVNAGANLAITVYLDGARFADLTGIVTPNVDTIVPIDVGRAFKGRQPRLVITSSAPFYPYWLDCVRRSTGKASEKPAIRVPLTIATGVGA